MEFPFPQLHCLVFPKHQSQVNNFKRLKICRFIERNWYFRMYDSRGEKEEEKKEEENIRCEKNETWFQDFIISWICANVGSHTRVQGWKSNNAHGVLLRFRFIFISRVETQLRLLTKFPLSRKKKKEQ